MGTVLLWSWVLKKKLEHCPGRSRQGLHCAALEGEWGQRKQKDERTGGWLQSQPTLKLATDSKYSEAQNF